MLQYSTANLCKFLIEANTVLTQESSGPTVQDTRMCRALDQLLLYLRLVHSVDYYNRAEYPTEDDMPNRCGLLHVRSSRPQLSQAASPEAVAVYIARTEKKLEAILTAGQLLLADREALKLGLKTEADELEKFMMANCQELAKDKWLCPLSGKKFKGPEFVKKHIHNRFADRVEEVRQEAQFFNNYLRDPGRPELPELTNGRPRARPSAATSGVRSGDGAAPGVAGHRGGGDYGAQRKRGSIRERLGVPVGPPGIREAVRMACLKIRIFIPVRRSDGLIEE